MFKPEDNTLEIEFNEVIDKALVARREQEPEREYLGGSRLGVECQRALAYEYHKVPKDEGRGFSGKIYRVFDMGHDAEARVAEYLLEAGFDLQMFKNRDFEDPRMDAPQIGWKLFPDEEGIPRVRGHLDGVIHSGPIDWPYPILWENKGLSGKSWRSTKKHGVQKDKPVYYTQMAVYMYTMKLNGALFTAINRDTGEIYPEFIETNHDHAVVSLERGRAVVKSESPDEFRRITENEDDFRCRFCDWRSTCHNAGNAERQSQTPEVPAWLT